MPGPGTKGTFCLHVLLSCSRVKLSSSHTMQKPYTMRTTTAYFADNNIEAPLYLPDPQTGNSLNQ